MFVFSELTLKDLHSILWERCQDGECTRQSSLAKSAVTDSANRGVPVNTVSNGAADAAAGVSFCHVGLISKVEVVMALRECTKPPVYGQKRHIPWL